MAKLYAELTSDKGGRIASKGGDKYIHTTLTIGNVPTYFVYLDGSRIVVEHIPTEKRLLTHGELTCKRHVIPQGNCKACRFDEDITNS